MSTQAFSVIGQQKGQKYAQENPCLDEKEYKVVARWNANGLLLRGKEWRAYYDSFVQAAVAEETKRRSPLCYYSVVTAASAKINRHLDIGDICTITNMGQLRHVEARPNKCVFIQMGDGEPHLISDAFVSKIEAQSYARQVLQKEITRLDQKKHQIEYESIMGTMDNMEGNQ